MFPIWLYFAVAALIVAAAFVIGQFAPGRGMILVVLASTIWTAYQAHHQISLHRNGKITAGLEVGHED